jgi:hypothetical protein
VGVISGKGCWAVGAPRQVFKALDLVIVQLKMRKLNQVTDASHAPQEIRPQNDRFQSNVLVQPGNDSDLASRRPDVIKLISRRVQRYHRGGRDNAVARFVVAVTLSRCHGSWNGVLVPGTSDSTTTMRVLSQPTRKDWLRAGNVAQHLYLVLLDSTVPRAGVYSSPFTGPQLRT